jgi:hypothetical protein
VPRGRPVRRGRDQARPVGGLRSADRRRALVASARRGRQHPGALPEPGRSGRRRVAYRGQLRTRRAPAGQHQLPRPRAAGPVPVQRRRRSQRADPSPPRLAPGRRPRAGPGRGRRAPLGCGGVSGGRRKRVPPDDASHRRSGRRVPLPPVPGPRRLVAAPGTTAPHDGPAGRRPARPVPADGSPEPGRAGNPQRHRRRGSPQSIHGELRTGCPRARCRASRRSPGPRSGCHGPPPACAPGA